HTHYTSIYVFFSYSHDHLDLHSFPTRRSSDLDPRDRGVAPAGLDEVVERRLEVGGGKHDLVDPVACQVVQDVVQAGPVHERKERSEEHTSELQSRGHLVCRLLLEKKKNKTKTG